MAITDGQPLFGENILHWDHGPVVKELYDELKIHGSTPVPVPEDFDPSSVFNKEQVALLTEVNNVYGQFSAWKLRDMTHNEAPWQSTKKDEIISHKSLQTFFKTLLV